MENSKEYILERIEEIKVYLEQKFKVISEIPDNQLRAVCYFSVLESFAQEYADYPQYHVNDAFCKFVLKFQSGYDFLNEFDPVTLFYDFEEELNGQFSLAFVDNYTSALDAVQKGQADKMVAALKKQGITPNEEKHYIERHRYVRLLYAMRSLLSHEGADANRMSEFLHHVFPRFPHYMSCHRVYDEHTGRKEDDVWYLVYPVGFLEELTKNCLTNYLKFCEETRRDPMENKPFIRKQSLTWYCDSFQREESKTK